MKPLILLVEDDPLDLELTVVALERTGLPHTLYVTRDGEEAIEFLCAGLTADHRRPALVVLDLKLPKLDGVEVLKRIRFTPALCDLPVVILSASNEEADRQRTAVLGVAHYLVKPIDWEGFSEVLSQVLMPVIPAGATSTLRNASTG